MNNRKHKNSIMKLFKIIIQTDKIANYDTNYFRLLDPSIYILNFHKRKIIKTSYYQINP